MIKETKRALLRIFVIVEIILFSLFYVFGSHGLQALYRLQSENQILIDEIQALKTTTDVLQQEITLWQTESLIKEKKAREQLQMARADDSVYYIS